MDHVNITVFGKVQGVNFRHHAREKALALSIKGFVENHDDGTVYIEAEGESTQLQQLLKWCWDGSPRATVNQVESEPGELQGYSSFEIRR